MNEVRQPCVIMASSGMCNAGRINGRLRNHLSSKASTILFVGHQSEGTLGRLILNGAREVRIHGQSFRVAAQIAQIYGFSRPCRPQRTAQIDGAFQQPPRKTFFTHGEEAVSLHFATHVKHAAAGLDYLRAAIPRRSSRATNCLGCGKSSPCMLVIFPPRADRQLVEAGNTV